jgi:hypothetical protein
VPFRQHQGGGAEGGGGAQDRPDIVRVGDLVEHDDKPGALQVAEIRLREGLAEHGDALMHGAGAGGAVDLVALRRFGERGDAELSQALQGVAGGQDAVDTAARIP